MRLRTTAGLLAALVGLTLASVGLSGAGRSGRAASSEAGAVLVVRFDHGGSRSAEVRILHRAGARSVKLLPKLHAAVATVPRSQRTAFLASVRRTRGVLSARADVPVRMLDVGSEPAIASSASESAQSELTDLQLAQQVTQGDPNVVVAVVDTGVQADHPGLAGRVLPGYDFVNNDSDAADDEGHGTAVAGVIAASGFGACAQCRILPVKVLAANGTGQWSTVADGIVWAADHGAQVINVSIGAPRALDVVGSAVAYAESKGAIVTAAAGNDGKNEPFYPADYPGVVSVAGVDGGGNRYSWSNYGSSVSVAAPGCASTTWIGSQFGHSFCGTSAASPFVAGLAGLARSFQPALTLPAFSSALASSSTPLPDGGTAAAGLVDANSLLIALGAPSGPPVVTTAPAVASTPVVGRRVVARPGAWQSASSLSLDWQRSKDGTTWRHVATGTAYTPHAADRGLRLRVVVTAQNARGAATVSSPASKPVGPLRAHAHSARATATASSRRTHH